MARRHPTAKRVIKKNVARRGRAQGDYTYRHHPYSHEPGVDESGLPTPGGSTGGTGGTGGGTAPPPFSVIPGLPPDIAQYIAQHFMTGDTYDEDAAMGYIRSTPWYAHEYAGIQGGVTNFQWNNQNMESEYRAYKNNVGQSYTRYYGRPPTAGEITSLLAHGFDAGTVEQQGQGYSYVAAHGGELQQAAGAFGGGALSQAELTAFGQQQAGLHSTLGDSIKAKVDLALQRMTVAFQGKQSTSANLEQSLGENIQRQRTPGIAA